MKLDTVFGYLLTPFAILMGVDVHDAVACGALLGQKTFINEFVAFQSLSNMQSGTHADFPPLQARHSLLHAPPRYWKVLRMGCCGNAMGRDIANLAYCTARVRLCSLVRSTSSRTLYVGSQTLHRLE